MDILDKMPKEIAKGLVCKEFKKGEAILYPEEKCLHVYFIETGTTEAYLQNSEGMVVAMYEYGAGNIFGEAEIFCPGMKTIGIVAKTPCRLYLLPHKYFLAWMKQEFAFTQKVVTLLVQKLLDNARITEELALCSVKERVLRCIARYYRMESLAGLTKAQIATTAHAPVRSVNRALAEAAKEGILKWEKGQFVVLEEKKLIEYL